MVDRPTNGERSIGLTPLRDQLARSLSRNLELRQQIEELEREKTGIPIEAATAALVRAMRSGEEAAVEASGARRYAISSLQATLRGVLIFEDGEWVLQPPRPEQLLPPEQMGSIDITLARLPEATPTEEQEVLAFLNAAQTPEEIAEAVEFPDERDVGVRVARRILDRRQELGAFTSLGQVAGVPQVGPERFAEIVRALGGPTPEGGGPELARALEGAQAAFSAWDREPGTGAAQDVVARTTHLLANAQSWGDEEFVRTAHALAQAMAGFGEEISDEVGSERSEPFRAAADRLLESIRRLAEAGFATPADMERLGADVQRLTRLYGDVSQA